MKNKPAKICGHIYENEICVVSDEKARKKRSQNNWLGLYFHRLWRKLNILINRSLDLWAKKKSEERRLVHWIGLNFKKRKGTKMKKTNKQNRQNKNIKPIFISDSEERTIGKEVEPYGFHIKLNHYFILFWDRFEPENYYSKNVCIIVTLGATHNCRQLGHSYFIILRGGGRWGQFAWNCRLFG